MSKEIWTSDQLNSLIEDINNGNTEAAKQLISNYADDIHFQAALYNSDKEAVSACYQKACNAAVKRISELDPASPEKWFETIAAETAISSAELTLETSEAEYDASNEYADTNISFPKDKAALRKGILHAVKDMSVLERAVFALRFYEHLNNTETAQKLHLDTTQVETLLTNAKSVISSKDISVPAVIAAMYKLNPPEKEEEPEVAPIIPAAAETVTRQKKTPGPKALLLALAAVLVLAAALFFISGRGKNPAAQNADNLNSSQNSQELTGSSDKSDETTTTDPAQTSNNGGSETAENTDSPKNESSSGTTHGLVVEDEIVEHVGTVGDNSNTSGSDNAGTSGNSGSQTENNPGSGDNNTGTVSQGGDESTTPSENPGTDSPDEEIDLGGGDILGGF